ncbi:hypothetical protein RN001_011212 [Aquatica leii]|uniref:Peptidase S1 domain-containing protein n=1 Tax=Aquatica leii TaxID=1421715 RepID=A0AAN7PBE7_9COLE|nr:hypothetical protein RN001_011212 [Aquatica leii]
MCSYPIVSILPLVVALSVFSVGHPAAALDKRIVNGTTAVNGQYPYQVSLRRNGLHFCGGSILNTRWILTVPYCFENFVNITAVVGTNTLNAGGIIYHVDSYIIHPLYDSHSFIYAAGLLNTTTRIVYNSKVQPIKLTPLVPIDGAVVVISGWGTNSLSSNVPVNELQSINTIAINFTDCQNALLMVGVVITSTHICTFNEHAGACEFDLGSPVTLCNMQYGIVTAVMCELGFPDTITKISSVYAWIRSVI